MFLQIYIRYLLSGELEVEGQQKTAHKFSVIEDILCGTDASRGA
jgi:hypothetical protein